MMTININRNFLLCAFSPLVIGLAAPVALAQEQSVEGVFALPDAQARVRGQMHVREAGPLSRDIELTYSDLSSGERLSAFDVELTQQLHLLAVDARLSTLIHEHVEQAEPDGRFLAELEFPEPGLYHVYADTTPSGLGQQVLRFDVRVGEDEQGASAKPLVIEEATSVAGQPLVSSASGYTVTLDATDLRAGAESTLGLTVEKDGLPASDLEPYLGVAAHAVFIRAEDLAYVHAHAMTAGADMGHIQHEGAHGPDQSIHAPAPAPDPHAMHGGEQSAGSHGAHEESSLGEPTTASGHSHPDASGHQAGHESTGMGASHAASRSVASEMIIHVTPPAPGPYALWIEFIGGGEVVTVPFALNIPQAQ